MEIDTLVKFKLNLLVKLEDLKKIKSFNINSNGKQFYYRNKCLEYMNFNSIYNIKLNFMINYFTQVEQTSMDTIFQFYPFKSSNLHVADEFEIANLFMNPFHKLLPIPKGSHWINYKGDDCIQHSFPYDQNKKGFHIMVYNEDRVYRTFDTRCFPYYKLNNLVILKSDVLVTQKNPLKYSNKSFGYNFVIPDGAKIETEDIVNYTIAQNAAIELMIIFKDTKNASLSAMSNSGTFPDIRGREKLTAEEFVNKWWIENTRNNPTPIFLKKYHNIEWFGFTVDHELEFSNNSGGKLVDNPKTVMITKHNNTFYRWEFDKSIEKNMEEILNTFEFKN